MNGIVNGNNPWESDVAEQAFGSSLKKLLSSSSSSTNVDVPEPTEDSFIQRLRTADQLLQDRRKIQLQAKLDVIHAEVRDILSPAALSELEMMLNQISSRMAPIADRVMLSNLSTDYQRKKDAICLKVDIDNQQKIRALFDFVDDLRSFGKNKTDEQTFVQESVSVEHHAIEKDEKVDEDGSDIVGPSRDALEACERMLQNGQTLREQYALLLSFHHEFKNHIFKGV